MAVAQIVNNDGGKAAARDRHHLVRCLARGKHDFGKTTPVLALEIDSREAQVFLRLRTERGQRLRHAQRTVRQALQHFLKLHTGRMKGPAAEVKADSFAIAGPMPLH